MKAPIIAYVAASSYLVPTVTGIRHWKKLNNVMKIFVIFFIYAVLHEIVSSILGKMHINNHAIITFYQLVEFECIFYIFFCWSESRAFKNGTLAIGIFFFIFWTLNKIYFEDVTKFNQSIDLLSCLFFLIISIAVLHKIISSTSSYLTKQAIFWIAAGVV